MPNHFAAAMQRAAALTRAGRLADATHHIQAALRGRNDAGAGRGETSGPGATAGAPGVLDLTAEVVERRRPPSTPVDGPAPAGAPRAAAPPRRPHRSLAETIRNPVAGLRALGELQPRPGRRRAATPSVAPGARFLLREFDSPAGRLQYRIYIPAGVVGSAEGVVLMLHGCKQDPDDFAVGTRMNEQAEANRLIAVYPGQATTANPAGCWNWFDPANQRRGAGEPAVLAALAEAVAGEFGVPRGRIFVGGLSAGGAMAAILSQAYPDVFAAAAIHSGLPAGSARDVASAFAAMRGTRPHDAASPVPPGASGPRLIVFHGTADRTVHPSNGDAIVAAHHASGAARSRTDGSTPGGRRYSRIVHRDANGATALEHWIIEGHGHAWSGGHEGGSYTDPKGPDASAEMIRFFLEASPWA